MILRLRQQATLTTRPDKTTRPLADLIVGWQARATAVLGTPVDTVIADVAAGRAQQLLRTADVSDSVVAGIAGRVVAVVGDRRATWRRWNLHAEASRQLMGMRFATTADRDRTLARVVEAAEQASVRLTPTDLAVVPAELQRADGSSVLRPRHATVFTSADLLAAEDRLLTLTRTRNGPRLPAGTVAQHADGLGADQTAAVATVATSGRVVDVLVGPAGAGKTTAMRSVRLAWEHLYGGGSVIGLAPSAAAAEVLAADLEIATETCAKWLHDHQAGRARMSAGQLVVVDEASLAGTATLDRISRAAADAGAKVLLVGDPAQLAAVDVGGAFALLARDRDDVAELTDVRRFTNPWEATATLRLRNGNPAVLDTYTQHDRLHDGDTDAMLDAAYTAWRTDTAAGKTSLLIAPTRDQVTALNTRARADRIVTGDVDPAVVVRLHDGSHASPGDIITTRRNDRRIIDATGRWVRNGDRWTVKMVHPDGSLTATRHGAGTVLLPDDYAATHVELGYATTAHRGQGATVDTAHAIVSGAMTRETLYVAMTRGRHANHAYTITDNPADLEAHHTSDPVAGRQVLTGVLKRVGADPSATQQTAIEQSRWDCLAQLAAEYDTIAAAAQHDRWTHLIRTSGLPDHQADQVIASDAFGPLAAALRRADAHGLEPERLLPRVAAARPIDGVDDIAAVLYHRLTSAIDHHQQQTPHTPAPDLIVGLIPAATGPMTPGMDTALRDREQLIQQRAIHVLRTALAENEPWIRHLGPPPTYPIHRRTWTRHAATVAAYRDRYNLTTVSPLGPRPHTDTQTLDAAAAANAVGQALTIAQSAAWTPTQSIRRAPAWSRQAPTL